MKLFEKWAWGCLSAFLFFSCGGKQEVEHTGAAEQKIVVDLSKAGKSYDLKNDLDPSGVVIVPLETHRECLIGRIERIFVRQDRIFIYDSQSKSVYFFDMEGRCTGKLHAYGVGPEEYASMTDAFVDEENIYVADSYRKQVQVYDLSGEYVKTIKTPDWSFYGIFTTESRIYYVNMGATHPVAGNYLLFSTDKDGGNFQKYLPFDPSIQSSLLFHLPYAYVSDGRTGFLNDNVKDVLYTVDDSGISPRYQLDFCGKKLPAEYFDQPASYILKNGLKNKYILFPEYISHAEDYLFFCVQLGVKSYTVIYDVGEQTTVAAEKISAFPFENISLKFSQGDRIVHVRDAYSLLASRSFLLEQFSKYPEALEASVVQRYEEVLSTVKEEDNPVLFLFRLKGKE